MTICGAKLCHLCIGFHVVWMLIFAVCFIFILNLGILLIMDLLSLEDNDYEGLFVTQSSRILVILVKTAKGQWILIVELHMVPIRLWIILIFLMTKVTYFNVHQCSEQHPRVAKGKQLITYIGIVKINVSNHLNWPLKMNY